MERIIFWAGLSRVRLALLVSVVFFAGIPGFAAQNVSLSWDASPDENVVGYNIYYGANSADYTNMLVAGSATNMLVFGLVEGTTYYFAATAYDIAGVESEFSNEVSYSVPLDVPEGTNQPPAMVVIGNQSIQKNAVLGPIPFVISDPDTAAENLTLTALSSSPTLVPVSNIVFGGSGSNRTVRITPVADRSGDVTIGIVVADNTGKTTTGTFSLTVLAGSGGAAPVILGLPNLTMTENSSGTNLPFVVVDTDTPIADVSVTVVSDNWTIVPVTNLFLSGLGTNRVLRLTPAPNQTGVCHVVVYAADDTGNLGASTMTVTVVAAPVTKVLTLITNGSGTVTPNLNVSSLKVGKSYAITAVPAAGQLFSGWSGDRSSSSAKLTFTLVSNMVLRANFVPNLYVPASGSYSGLFSEEDGVRLSSAGLLTASLTTRGSYSGKVQIAGKSYSISGKLSLQCQATNRIKRGTNYLTITFRAGQSNEVGQLFGQLTDGVWTSSVQDIRAVYNSKTNPALFAGNYTLVLPGASGNPLLPTGHSYGSLRVSSNGVAAFTGKLADGTAISQGVTISQDTLWPLYGSLYSGKGLLLGSVAFASESDSDLHGDLVWIKSANPKNRYYPAGFEAEPSAFGSRYLAPTRTNAVVRLIAAPLEFSGGNLPSNFTNLVTVGASSKVFNLSSNKLSLKFTLSNGTYSGSVTDPGTGKSRSFSGAVFQKLNAGYGYLLGTNQTSQVTFAPAP